MPLVILVFAVFSGNSDNFIYMFIFLLRKIDEIFSKEQLQKKFHSYLYKLFVTVVDCISYI